MSVPLVSWRLFNVYINGVSADNFIYIPVTDILQPKDNTTNKEIIVDKVTRTLINDIRCTIEGYLPANISKHVVKSYCYKNGASIRKVKQKLYFGDEKYRMVTTYDKTGVIINSIVLDKDYKVIRLYTYSERIVYNGGATIVVVGTNALYCGYCYKYYIFGNQIHLIS